MTGKEEKHPRAGMIYQFNKVRAKVIGFTDEEISWQEDGKQAVHKTPRWYFEQHSTIAR